MVIPIFYRPGNVMGDPWTRKTVEKYETRLMISYTERFTKKKKKN